MSESKKMVEASRTDVGDWHAIRGWGRPRWQLPSDVLLWSDNIYCKLHRWSCERLVPAQSSSVLFMFGFSRRQTLLLHQQALISRIRFKTETVTTTRKPCCRKETARCRKCSFRLKLANNIHNKYKTSQASKVTLQSSKHAGAKHNLTQNQDSKSFKVTCLESGKAVRQ